jgi:hypothetical protein
MALTVNRCLLFVQLRKGKTHLKGADFSHEVVVKSSPISLSNTISFHNACQAILQATLGQLDGEDLRPSHKTNSLEFVSIRCKQPRLVPSRTWEFAITGAHGLEQAHELLNKILKCFRPSCSLSCPPSCILSCHLSLAPLMCNSSDAVMPALSLISWQINSQ